MTEIAKCARPTCNCVPADGEQYCSSTCADAKGVTELTCQCQHAVCQGVTPELLLVNESNASFA